MSRNVAIMMALMVCGLVKAAQLHVPAQYGTIQAAVNAASNGDVILVAPGNYAGWILEDPHNMPLSITIRATGSAAETIVESTGPCSSVISCFGNDHDDDVVIDGLTITGGGCPDGEGGGIWCGWLRNLTIKNCVFSNNSVANESSFGGGLWMAQIYGSASITNCTFSNNSANDGGGIYCSGTDDLTIANCTFSNNSADIGGDIYVFYDVDVTIDNCDFCGNGNNSIHGPYSGSGNTFLNECPQACPDTNDDGHVGIADLLLVLENWMGSTDGDVDDNGLVELEDLVLVLENWGPCP